MENGLFHACDGGPTIYKARQSYFHAKYYRAKYEDKYRCIWCPCSFPSFLALPFKIISQQGLSFIGSKKIISSLENRNYEIIEI